ncbi:DNA-binding protein [Vagococcus humatus]|uniref:DNA-binding protein n=1 Tax=Vagococcus humatus TaxID=1889241 RepID=A0A3S0A4I2_9ENTE|nr:DNA-binding protein [Vagococcus humatus]RST88723.1 DNA-binding protein [Vagococcus humatus]
MQGLQVFLSEEQSKDLQKYVFELTKESIEEAKKMAGLDRPFLKQNEMAKYLGISINSLRKLETYGLPSIQIDGLKFYSKEEATKFLLSYQK